MPIRGGIHIPRPVPVLSRHSRRGVALPAVPVCPMSSRFFPHPRGRRYIESRLPVGVRDYTETGLSVPGAPDRGDSFSRIAGRTLFPHRPLEMDGIRLCHTAIQGGPPEPDSRPDRQKNSAAESRRVHSDGPLPRDHVKLAMLLEIGGVASRKEQVAPSPRLRFFQRQAPGAPHAGFRPVFPVSAD